MKRCKIDYINILVVYCLCHIYHWISSANSFKVSTGSQYHFYRKKKKNNKYTLKPIMAFAHLIDFSYTTHFNRIPNGLGLVSIFFSHFRSFSIQSYYHISTVYRKWRIFFVFHCQKVNLPKIAFHFAYYLQFYIRFFFLVMDNWLFLHEWRIWDKQWT